MKLINTLKIMISKKLNCSAGYDKSVSEKRIEELEEKIKNTRIVI